MRISLCSVFLPTLMACGQPATGGSDADVNAEDAAPKSCSERMPLSIGHCLDSATGAPCLDFSAETRSFVDLEASGPVSPVIGLQGSPMFVLAVEAQGIVNGENELAPLVNLEVTNADEHVGGFSSRPLFVAGDSEGVLRAPQLFVVSFFADEQVGLELQVQAEIEDREQQLWCQSGSFTVGPLIDAPPLP